MLLGLTNLFLNKVEKGTIEDQVYVSKLPFPAFVCTTSGNLLAANRRLFELLDIASEDLSEINWHPKKSLWREFANGKTTTYEEQFYWKTYNGTKIFRAIGHVNGRGCYCSIQDVTNLYKTNKLLSLISKAK